jgi:hypothetical protein
MRRYVMPAVCVLFVFGLLLLSAVSDSSSQLDPVPVEDARPVCSICEMEIGSAWYMDDNTVYCYRCYRAISR